MDTRQGAVLLPFRLGAFKAAGDAGRRVVPVTMRGTRAMLRLRDVTRAAIEQNLRPLTA